MKREINPHAPGPEHDAGRRIDAALRSVGATEPEPGFEGRILTRLAAARLQTDADTFAGARLPGFSRRLPRFIAPVLGLASVGLVCAVIIGGSVSRPSAHASSPVAPPILQLPGQGVGAASAVHPAAPVSTPLPPDTVGRGHASRHANHGRARIAPHAHKAAGVGIPAPVTPP